MLIAFIMIALAAFFGVAHINETRLSKYLNEVAKGTFTLIAEGAARHEGEKRAR